MNSFSPFDQLGREQNIVYINDVFVPGIQSCDFTNPYNNTQLSYIGQRSGVTVFNRNTFPQVNLNCKLIGYDRLFSLSGTTLMNIYFMKDRFDPMDGVQCISGAMTSYRQSCSIGDIPEISAGVEFYGKVGYLKDMINPPFEQLKINDDLSSVYNFHNNNSTIDALRVIGPGSIDITFSNSSFRNISVINSNAITAYSFELQYDRRPNFRIGNFYPFSVDLKKPINFSLQIEVDLSEINTTDIISFYENKEITNIRLDLKDYNSLAVINSYTFSNIEPNSVRCSFTPNSITKGTFDLFGVIF